MDAISEVLRTVRLGGAVYLNGEFTAPWCVIGEGDTALYSAFLPQSERVVSFHLITEGTCWARLSADPKSAILVSAGELLVIPQGEPHSMGSAVDLSPASLAHLLSGQLQSAPGDVMKVSYGKGGERTRVVCGFLASDDALTNPLLSSLPRIFKVDMRGDPRSAWLESSLQFAVTEAADSRAGSSIVLARLSELLFVEAVRRCVDTLPEEQKGWLAGVRDRFVGRALSLLHARPAYGWTVDELAQKAGLSRSALAQRFTDLVGQPVMQYLASWRLQIAAQELLSGNKSLAAVSEQVGYESEAAFNRAFKREFGMPPAGWRKKQSKPGSAAAVAKGN